jgi:hypothetical protein
MALGPEVVFVKRDQVNLLGVLQLALRTRELRNEAIETAIISAKRSQCESVRVMTSGFEHAKSANRSQRPRNHFCETKPSAILAGIGDLERFAYALRIRDGNGEHTNPGVSEDSGGCPLAYASG